jgi:DNA repair photolyase
MCIRLFGGRCYGRPVTELRWRLADGPSDAGSDGEPARDRRGRGGGPFRQEELFAPRVFDREPGIGEYRGLEFLHVKAQRIINEVKGAPFGFRYSINAYRGCSHACLYCFARPTHEYLNLGAGEDFESKIVVKVNAASQLQRELRSPRWSGDPIAMGTNTDPYQRAEGKYRLTRGILDVLVRAGNPFSILTKSTLVLRDLPLLAAAARRDLVRVNLSIGTLDEDVWRLTEPGTPHPLRRVRAVERLNQAGVPCGVLIAPVLPGLSDRPDQLDAVVRACAEAGARSLMPLLLHLRPGVREVFFGRLEATRPDLVGPLARRYRNRVYAPRRDQAQLVELVREAAARYGAHLELERALPDGEVAVEAPVVPSRQLSLL